MRKKLHGKQLQRYFHRIHLNLENEIAGFDEVSLDDLQDKVRANRHAKKIAIEQYRQISMDCITDNDFKRSHESFKDELSTKILFLFGTCILSYYCVYQAILLLVQGDMGNLGFSIFMVILFALIFMSLINYIYKRNFSKIQLYMCSIIYTILSMSGIITLLVQAVPFSSYQALNAFIVFLLVQVLVWYISLPISRKIACRIDNPIDHEIIIGKFK